VDLRVNKGANPGDPAPGNEYVYWISFNNDRPASALNVRITDTLPVSVTFVSVCFRMAPGRLERGHQHSRRGSVDEG
jgi:uncharacterized repeat protein (TIGR01451 family)